MEPVDREWLLSWWSAHGGRVKIEPTGRRVRPMLGGRPVADSTRAQLLYLPPPFGTYVVPDADVAWDRLRESSTPGDVPGLGPVRQWDAVEAGRDVGEAVWKVVTAPAGVDELAGLVGFRWDAMDAWFEEDDEVFVHPRDPYHRVDVLHSSRHVRVSVAGETVAETRRPRLLFETSLPTRYYIPIADVRMDLLERSATTSRCPYKGTASYRSVRVGGELHVDLAWTYEAPIPECPKIENLICFFNERVDIEVDGEEIPRPDTPWSH